MRAPNAAHVLVVDDDENMRRLIARILTRHGHVARTAESGFTASAVVNEWDVDLVLCDVMMPDESGIDLLTRLRKADPDLPFVMVSEVADTNVAAVALQAGAYGYVTKPFDASQLLIAVTNALCRSELERQNRDYRERLEWMVTERTVELGDALHELAAANQRLERSAERTIQTLAQAIEGRDIETGQHVVRMSRYARVLAEALGLDASYCELIGMAAAMHDVGKVGVPDGILFKPGQLTPAEFDVIKAHAELGYRILSQGDEPLLATAASIARTHHERWDGSGYPQGLRGQEIPLEGRIAAVADVFDAVISRRCYKPAYSLQRALTIIREGSGSLFDPAVVDVFFERLDDIVAIQSQNLDDA